ncbi:hypothetical protein K2173_007996 [Erythroxylum novogranatense]|uniref:Uncharacterized protein n=1 Tax=Erythroxylum novogranatense TaxID=1862640 RepID=A0AAV8T787_9ROSI|nr:hypothetical protein K2173_007996 [Erythroxylum novogranatense]
MSIRRSLVPTYVTTPVVMNFQRYEAANPHLWFPLVTRSDRRKLQLNGNQMFQTGTSILDLRHNSKKRNTVVYGGVEPDSAPPPSDRSPAPWNGWILGIVVTIILPSTRNKWGPLLRIKEQFDSVVETAEQVTELVEDVAEAVDKVSEEIGEHVPEDSALDKAAEFVEDIAEETVKNAKLADALLEKVEEVEKEVFSAIDSDIDKAGGTGKEAKP